MCRESFEKSRISAFHGAGLDVHPRRIRGRDGRQTYLLTSQEGPRPTVLVHGGLAEASVWLPLARKVPGPLVLPDRPGCGLSDPMDYRGVDYRAHAVQWLSEVLDALAAKRVHLVGNSMGGYFCLAFALAHPERVERLILLGAPAGLDRSLPLFLRLWGNPIVGPLISRVAIPRDPERLRDQVFRDLVAHPERISREALQLALAAARLPGADSSARTMLGCVTDLGGWRRELLLRDEATHLSVPTTFLWGEHDAFAPPASGQALAESMREATVEIVPDAGHLPHFDAPDWVASRLRPLIDTSASRPPGAAPSG